MKDDILKTAVKIARIIDGNAERDIALSKIAQLQAAANCPEEALETIAQIRYVDIRADALRIALDNLQTRYFLKKENMPQMDLWLEKLMEDTMAIPEIEVRCPKLHAINLLILSRLDEKEKVLNLLEQSRNEFVRLSVGRKRSKYLFALYQLFYQLNNEAEAIATLENILERISDYKPDIQQGLMIGLVAYEFWKIQGRHSALECIESIQNKTVQSYAFLQLVELLAVGGNVKDALEIAKNLDDEEQKSAGDSFIRMGRSFIRNVFEMKGAIICLNKSFYFSDKFGNQDFGFSSREKKSPVPRPVWFSLTVSISPKDKEDSDADESDAAEDNKRQDERETANSEQIDDSCTQETDWDKYDWDGYNWDKVKSDNKELEKFWSENDCDDEDGDDAEDNEADWEESDDDDGEDWKGSDDEDNDGEGWKGSDDEEDNDGEDWKESDDEEDDEDVDWKESDDEDDDEDDDSSNKPDKNLEKKLLSKFLEMKQREFLKKFANHGLPEPLQKIFMNRMHDKTEEDQDEAPRDRYFCMTEEIQGIVSFNRLLPPGLYQHFLRRLSIFFPIVNKDVKKNMTPHYREKIEDYIVRQSEIGFEAAWQEVISQGDYYFAVECALNDYYLKHKESLVFGFVPLS